ncbi:alkyl hydroperoxide reductase subunit AhpC [Anaerobacterium chartisolvens]|uniref:Alkyl hydroperoxide reductase subunit AhpC n=1 Tax=Anaerobacterium chartisolvens TaxID=1297424 RepID=A0A369BA37_9FIRM|nr:peroxiredoxin [Anaerobacterium chartisolvens]RCX18399.1 alkyl hydroperoxide reductase subunit AhpC [Anaerobacterium chartisolvens]
MERLVGMQAPHFKMEAVEGNGDTFTSVDLYDYKGKWLVLFFYPLDFTFVCPTEISGISRRIAEFKDLKAEVVGVSIDSVHSHKAWINSSPENGGLGKINYPLASDITKEVSRNYGVLLEQNGIALRGLFIIDPKGVVKYSVIHDLNVGRSVDETLRVLQALQSGGLCPIDWQPGEAQL